MYNIPPHLTTISMKGFTHFAALTNYGDDVYNSSTTYNGETTDTSTAAPAPAPSGTLANTGVAILGASTLACLIVLTAITVRVWRRPRAAKRS